MIRNIEQQPKLPPPQILERVAASLHAIDRVAVQNVHNTFAFVAADRQERELAVPKRNLRRLFGGGGEPVPEMLVIEWSNLYTCKFLNNLLEHNLRHLPPETAQALFTQLVRGYKKYYLKLLFRNLSLYAELCTLVVYITMPESLGHANSETYLKAVKDIETEEIQFNPKRTFARLVHSIVMNCTKTLRHLILVEDHHASQQILQLDLHFAELLANAGDSLHTLYMPSLYHLYRLYDKFDDDRQEFWKELLEMPAEKRLPNLRRLVLYSGTYWRALEVPSKSDSDHQLLTFPSTKCVIEAASDLSPSNDDFMRQIFPQCTTTNSMRRYWRGTTMPTLIKEKFRSYELAVGALSSRISLPKGFSFYTPFTSSFARERIARTQNELTLAAAVLSEIIGPTRADQWFSRRQQRHGFYFPLHQYVGLLEKLKSKSSHGDKSAEVVASATLTSVNQLRESNQMLARLAADNSSSPFAVFIQFRLFKNFDGLQARVVESALAPWIATTTTTVSSSLSAAHVYLVITIPNRQVLENWSSALLEKSAKFALASFCFDPARVEVKLKQHLGLFTLRCEVVDVVSGNFDRSSLHNIKGAVANAIDGLCSVAERHAGSMDFFTSVFSCTRVVEFELQWAVEFSDVVKEDAHQALPESCKKLDEADLKKMADGILTREVLRCEDECRQMLQKRWLKSVEDAGVLTRVRRIDLKMDDLFHFVR